MSGLWFLEIYALCLLASCSDISDIQIFFWKYVKYFIQSVLKAVWWMVYGEIKISDWYYYLGLLGLGLGLALVFVLVLGSGSVPIFQHSVPGRIASILFFKY